MPCPTGTVADQFVLKRFPDAVIKYYNTVLDCAIAVKQGKADAAVYDKPVLKNIAAKNDGLTVIEELLEPDKYGFAVQLKNTELKKIADEVLAEFKSDGTYEDMMKRWFPEKGNPKPMPEIKLTGTNGVLRFGTAAVTEPMSFFNADRKIVGFDIEFATYIARKSGKQLEIIDMEFGAMLPALISGKVDMIGAGLSITEERAKSVLFTESYYPSGIAAVVNSLQKSGTENAKVKFTSEEDIKTRRVGVLMGSVYDTYAKKNYPDAEILQYSSVSDVLIALETDKADAAFFDHVSLKEVLAKYKTLGILAENIFTLPIGAGFNSDDDQLREQFNAFLKQIKSDGTYKDMSDRWMMKDNYQMPDIKSSGTNGDLRVGIVSDIGSPFSFILDGNIVGFDIELSKRFAAYVGKVFVPVDNQFGSQISALVSRKIDLTTCSMMITEEREKQIDFSDPYYESGVDLIAKKENISFASIDAPSEEVSYWESISTSFNNNLVLENRYKLILDGLSVTIIISICAALFGTLVGALICFMRMSKRKLLSSIARLYISLLRGTPVLVLLMIIYYVVFASVNISAVVVAVLAFGLNFGAYVSEMFRTSIESVDKGQSEAGIAGGFTKIQTFMYIIMPQALRRVLPVYKGEFISLVKMTSIVGYIAVQDLTKASDIIRSRTFDAFFPLLMAAVIYLALAWLLTWALSKVEISVEPKRRPILQEVRVS